jgi:hypothetical protein
VPAFAISAQDFDCALATVIIVGNEDEEFGVGGVMELGQNGVAMIKVFPGSVAHARCKLFFGQTGSKKALEYRIA